MRSALLGGILRSTALRSNLCSYATGAIAKPALFGQCQNFPVLVVLTLSKIFNGVGCQELLTKASEFSRLKPKSCCWRGGEKSQDTGKDINERCRFGLLKLMGVTKEMQPLQSSFETFQ